MLQDLRIEKEVLQALLAEMEKQGFVATTLHEIRTFAMEQRRTRRAVDSATPCAVCGSTNGKHYGILGNLLETPNH